MIPVFNFLRGWACFFVVIAHIFQISCKKVVINGAFGMAIFFFITGFLIPLTLDKLESSKKFLIRRCFRLFPVLAFSIFFVVMAHYAFGLEYRSQLYASTGKLIKSILITLFSIDFGHGENFNFSSNILLAPAWSLAVEWKFYFIASLSWFVFKEAKLRLYGMIAFTGMLLALSLQSNIYYGNIRSNIALIYVCIVGSITYFYYFKHISKKEFLFLLICLLIIIFKSTMLSRNGRLLYSIGALLTTIIVLKFPNFGNNKVCKFFADISYSMYLLHIVFLSFVLEQQNFIKNFSIAGKIAFGVGIYVAVIPFCYLIYRFIEKPFIKIGYRLTDGVKK